MLKNIIDQLYSSFLLACCIAGVIVVVSVIVAFIFSKD